MEADTGKLTERDFRDLLEALCLKAIYTPTAKELTVRVALPRPCRRRCVRAP